MEIRGFESKDYWRALILYGQQVATYKIALGQCLAGFVAMNKSQVTMPELAESFFDVYRQRLLDGKPQLQNPARVTVMEKVVMQYNAAQLTRTEAIEKVAREAFNDVIPRFHTLNTEAVDIKFYEPTDDGLILHDALHEVFTGSETEKLKEELASRWDLLEAAFAMRRTASELVNDIRLFYLSQGYERTNITHTRPVLNGYQQGRCFYCGELMLEGDVHVDHLIPRQVLYHDEVWNLVLAHSFCNQKKMDALPAMHFLSQLHIRNEHFIASNHPIRAKIIAQLGATTQQRWRKLKVCYEDARLVLGVPWEGFRGYDPSEDIFYREIIRRLNRR